MIRHFLFKVSDIYPFLGVLSEVHKMRPRKAEIDACIDRVIFEGAFREPLVLKFLLSTDEQIRKFAKMDLSRLERDKLLKLVKEHSVEAVCVSGTNIIHLLDILRNLDHPEASEVLVKVVVFMDVLTRELESKTIDLVSRSGRVDEGRFEFLSRAQFDYLRLRFDAQDVLSSMQELMQIRPEFGAYRIGKKTARVALKKEFLTLHPVFVMAFITVHLQLDSFSRSLFGNWIRGQSFHRSLQNSGISSVCASSGFVLNNMRSYLSLTEELQRRFEFCANSNDHSYQT